MSEYQAPFRKLHFFKDEIGITQSDLTVLDPFRSIFAGKQDEFADYFYDFFYQIPATKAILDREKERGTLKRMWSQWFAAFFLADFNDTFLGHLWTIGARHVEVNLDQRFSNLGFAVIRQFCQKMILLEAPADKQAPLLTVTDKLLDLCLLVETDAYIENATNCDIEVMREMADRVRNPAMIIGWNIKKLRDKVGAESKEYRVYDTVISENQRLENLVKDVKVYMDMFQAEPAFQNIHLEMLIETVLGRLREEKKYGDVKVSLDIDQETASVSGDPKELEHLFYYLLQNSMEAVSKDDPRVEIRVARDQILPNSLQIELFNTGDTPEGEEIEKLFSPFFSTKLIGTGFGLPIARIIAKKHHGTLSIQPASGKGTSVIICLPRPSSQPS
jgi:signal transduction histidine kinase